VVVAAVLTQVECFNAPQASMLFVALEQGLMVVVVYLLETGNSALPSLSARMVAVAISSQTMECSNAHQEAVVDLVE
jgi:hypothetical protein